MPIKVPKEAMSFEEANNILVAHGVPRDLLEAFETTAQLGKTVSSRGDLDFVVGSLMEEVEILREAQKLANQLYNTPGITTKERAEILERKSKQSAAISMVLRDLAKATAANTERHKNGKTKSKSFAPDQHVTAVQVTVNNQPTGPNAPQ